MNLSNRVTASAEGPDVMPFSAWLARPLTYRGIKMKIQVKKLSVSIAIVTLMTFLFASNSFSHCQIPCGIYDDHARVDSMRENVDTVRKSVSLINELSGKTDPHSQNQLVRWVVNKEQHAQFIIDTISDYFLTQRVKSSQEDYAERLQKHHAVIVAAMRAKQNADMESVDDLALAVEGVAPYYPAH